MRRDNTRRQFLRSVGIDHMGLGGDIDGIEDHQWPVGMDHLGHLPRLTAELLRRGFSGADLAKFLGENWRRALARCLP